VKRVKIGEILRETQAEVYKELNKKPKKKNEKRRNHSKADELSFSDIKKMMNHDSYRRGSGGAVRQKTWSD
jgi:hypothetical protein